MSIVVSVDQNVRHVWLKAVVGALIMFIGRFRILPRAFVIVMPPKLCLSALLEYLP